MMFVQSIKRKEPRCFVAAIRFPASLSGRRHMMGRPRHITIRPGSRHPADKVDLAIFLGRR
jgi:hypothetical protein